MTYSDTDLPADYVELLEALKTRVSNARIEAQRTVNTLLIELYWSLGQDILSRQERQGWGVVSLTAWQTTCGPRSRT
jgi:hypothetical protein